MSYIETPRLLLRTWMVPGDIADATEIFSDSAAMRYSHDRWRRPQKIAELLETLMQDEERDGFGLWPVVLKETRRVIGDCGLSRAEDSADLELSYHFKTSAWGHGYATEAAAAVCDFAFEVLRAPRLLAHVDRDNAASINVLGKLGFRFDRALRVRRFEALRYVKEPV